MEKLLKQRKIIKIIILIIIAFLFYLFFFYYRNILFGPAILFNSDENINIGLWPNDYKGVLVFTIDDIDALTNLDELKKVMDLLNDYNIKTTLFVIPYYKNIYKITKDNDLGVYLKKQEGLGNEIAQHGLTHFSRRKSILIKNNYKELSNLPYSEQKRRILLGKEILEKSELEIKGFRAPAFGIDKKTFKILDEEKFLYDSSIRVSPWILMNNKRIAESLFYPFHISELSLIEIITNGDFFWESRIPIFERNRYNILKKRFDIYYDNEGVFVLLSHIEKLPHEKNLKILKKFLDYQKDKNVWRTTLKEVAKWWIMREELYAETFIDKDILKIMIETSYEENINGLTIEIKNKEVKYYKIYINNKLIKEGKIEDNKIIL
ncbi:MAG: DUF2334 domain-containing protein [Candidatus Pacearchaeota archaeon]